MPDRSSNTTLPPHCPTAPEVAYVDSRGRRCSLHSAGGRPVLWAFVEGDPLASMDEARWRAELRGLGAALIVVSEHAVHLLQPDDAIEPLTPENPGAGNQHPRLSEPARGPLTLALFDEPGAIAWRHDVCARGEDSAAMLLSALRSAATTRRAGELPDNASEERGGEKEGIAGALVMSRREMMFSSLVALLSLTFANEVAWARQATPPAATSERVTLTVNGRQHALDIDPRVTLLDALREYLGFTGTKKGCDHGQCGACTVLVDGRRINACLTLAIMQEGRNVTTIEGLATGGALHRMQAAFLARDAFQCGYCTPGQIVSAVALVAEGHARKPDEIREQMSGNLCRCGAYPNIVAAIADVIGG